MNPSPEITDAPRPICGCLRPCAKAVATSISAICTLLFMPVTGMAAGDDTGPVTLTTSDFKELLENSPFTRTISLSDTLALTGVAQIGGRPVLTLLNRATKESILVSEEPNAQGWKIIEIYPSEELGKIE